MFDAVSVITTLWAPLGTDGTVKVTVDDPLAFVVPPAVMVAVVPSTLTVRADVAAKPAAVIVALVPTGPDVGVSPVAEAVTVKFVAEVAVFDEASVTTTLWAPLGTAGTLNVTVEDPLPFVVPPEVMVALVPSTLTVSAELSAKPVAEIVALVPTGPDVGASPVAEAVTAVGVTVKLVAEVAVFDEASVTTTLWAPLGTDGTVKVTVDDPLAFVVPPEVMVALVPPTLTVRADEAAKPWAVMVALVPTGPDVGVSPVAEVVTVKFVAEVAVFDEASVTTTLWAPLGTDGTVNVTVEDPLVPVVAPEVMVAVVPPTLTVRADEAAKPWAVMVALVPTGPDVGVSPVAEVVTVKFVAEVAVFDEASVTTTSGCRWARPGR